MILGSIKINHPTASPEFYWLENYSKKLQEASDFLKVI